jgi:SOS-response transcriptional repressor LexA/predicted RNA-binding Zn-ribbon protein involved in translation (DUF1610 family)
VSKTDDPAVEMSTVTLKGYQCRSCGHQWLPRKSSTPKWCPNCGSENWQTGRKRPPIKEQYAAAAARRAALAEKEKRQPLPAEKTNSLLKNLGEWVKPTGHEYIVWGSVNAGPWLDVTDTEPEKITDYQLLDWSNDNDMALRITANGADGECLVGDGIYPGDTLQFRCGIAPENGDVVLAVGTDKEGRVFATVKHWHQNDENIIELRPSNDKCATIYAFEHDVEIHGVLINVVQVNWRERLRRKQREAQKMRESALEKVKATKEKAARPVVQPRAASTRATKGKVRVKS